MSKYNYKLSESDYAAAYKLYQGGQSLNAIGLLYNVSSTAIHGAFKRRGWICRSQSESQQRHSVNHSAFSEITEASAYWAGFIMADGSIGQRSKNSYQITIRLHRKDVDHLRKLRDFISPDAQVSLYDYNHEPSCQFSVKSKQMAYDLANMGVTHNKSTSPSVPDPIVNNHHFWRGVFDGDGSIATYWNKRNQVHIPHFRLYGERSLLLQFKEFLTSNGLNSQAQVLPHRSIYCYALSGSSAIRSSAILYKGSSIYMKRKFNAAINISVAGRGDVNHPHGSAPSAPRRQPRTARSKPLDLSMG